MAFVKFGIFVSSSVSDPAIIMDFSSFIQVIVSFYSQEACIDVQIFEFSLSSGGNNAKRLAWYNEANFALSTNCAKLLVKQSTI